MHQRSAMARGSQSKHVHRWNVFANGFHIGCVFETTESFARCAAICRYGIADDELEAARGDRAAFGSSAIFSDTDFSVVQD